jgi:hypothetical protein
LYPASPVSSSRFNLLTVHCKEVSRRNRSQIGIPRDLVGSPACPFAEISFGHCLQPPGDPSKEMFPMPASRFFLKYLPILLAQPAKLSLRRFSISINSTVSTVSFLLVAVNHSHMNALRVPTGKGILRRMVTITGDGRVSIRWKMRPGRSGFAPAPGCTASTRIPDAAGISATIRTIRARSAAMM